MKWSYSVLQPSTKNNRNYVWRQKDLATDFASWSPLRIPRWDKAFPGHSNIQVLLVALKLFMGTLLFSAEHIHQLKEIEQSFHYPSLKCCGDSYTVVFSSGLTTVSVIQVWHVSLRSPPALSLWSLPFCAEEAEKEDFECSKICMQSQPMYYV